MFSCAFENKGNVQLEEGALRFREQIDLRYTTLGMLMRQIILLLTVTLDCTWYKESTPWDWKLVLRH